MKSTLTAEILELKDTYIFIKIKDESYYNGSCRMYITDETKFFNGEIESDITMLRVNQNIQVVIRGGLKETHPLVGTAAEIKINC